MCTIVQELLYETIDNIITTWLSVVKCPRRLVMTKIHWCSICDTTENTNKCSTHNYDSPSGRCIHGWTFCEKCSVYNDLLHTYYYMHYTSFIRRKHIRPLKKKIFSFYRKPSDTSIVPYIEHNGYYLDYDMDFICINNTHTDIYVTIAWNKYIKSVPLTNIIFYNRHIFGYEYNEFPIIQIPRKMIPILHKHYRHCKEWYILDCIFHYHKTNIPMDIQTIIFRFWNNVYIL